MFKGPRIAIVVLLLVIVVIVALSGFMDSEPNSDRYDIGAMAIDDPSEIESLFELRNTSFWGPYRDEYLLSDDKSKPFVNSNPNAEGVLGGDERKFTAIRKNHPGERFKRAITLEPNSEYELYIYFNNNSEDQKVLEPLININLPLAISKKQEISTSFRSQNQQLGYVYSDVAVSVISGNVVSVDPKTISFYGLDGKLQNSTESVDAVQHVSIVDLQRGIRPLCGGQESLEPNCGGFAILKFETPKAEVDFTVKGRNDSSVNADNSDNIHVFGNYLVLEKVNGKYQIELLAQLVNRSRLTVEKTTIYFDLVSSPNAGVSVISAKWINRALSQKSGAQESGEDLKPWIEQDAEGSRYEEYYRIDPPVALEPGRMLETYYVLNLSDDWVKNLCKTNRGFLKVHYNLWGNDQWGDNWFPIIPSVGVC